MPAPIGRAEPAADAVEAAAPEVRPLRILLVDDLEVNRELVSAMLAQFDVAITEASSGAEAVAASLRERFDLVLMDLQMPGMDGMEATRAIRASAELNQATPILALSANVMADQIEACRAAGMNDHIAKPIEPRNLLAKIAYWTEEADDGAQAAQA
jgi:CheY-like chemotaxis protein